MALDVWEKALGFKPLSFRPGNLSANMDTYKVLYKLGFRQGSSYIPNRNIRKGGAVWVNADPFPHHVSGLDFLEVPITSDISEPIKEGDPVHLRIERYNAQILCKLVEKWVSLLVERNVRVKTIVNITHNTIDYSDRECKCRKRLEELIKCIENCCNRYGLELKPTNLESLHSTINSL